MQPPEADISIGLEYVFVNVSQSGGEIRLLASGTDILKLSGAAGVTSLLAEPGAVYRVRARMPGGWSVLEG